MQPHQADPTKRMTRARRRPTRGVIAVATLALLVGMATLSMSDTVPVYHRRLLLHLPAGVRQWPVLSFSSVWGLHFAAFAVLTFVAVLTVRTWWSRAAVVVGLMTGGWLIEIVQRDFTTARNYQTVDLAADGRGIAVGFTAAVCLLTLRSQIRPRHAPVRVTDVQNGKNSLG